ncbi:rho GDP-dissociation inhibitor 1 isoform X1 [Hevea brasiliensis]|uniref:rho GDP-dissociation inhibitor 1 isoform X1 n=1 Tax=Hevea brasiliensis TaxID=3981 RepID=UPI0025EB996E|nr:rho GDP-dissociation inhibitor 1 isoform X1 [Hevea brasiliensis]
MDGGKGVEAGPSTTGVVGEKQERQKEMADKALAEAVIDYDDDEEEEEEEGSGVPVPVPGFVPGPLLSLKEQIEKDQDDDSLRRWKEKLLGCVEGDLNGLCQMEPEVKFHSIGIISSDFGEINTPLPVDGNRSSQVHFTLKEGSRYQLKLTFNVLHNIVSGLNYSNIVWKGGLQVDQSKGMLGTFAPQREPYVHTLEEETTPSGALARGIYSAKLKFEDDDRRCHMDLKYSFEIKKRS